MSLTQLYLHEINKVRTNPQSYVEKFEKICIELSTVKRKQALYQELLGFVEKLKRAPAVPALRLSQEFSTISDLRIDSIIANKGFENDDFMDIANNNASGFEDIYQLYDQFNDSPTNFLVDQLMDPKDDAKTNRTIIFDPNLEYIGINNLETAKKQNIILLVFADNIDGGSGEEKTKQEEILDFINLYRCDTKMASATFEEVLVQARIAKKPQKYIDMLNDLLEHCYNNPNLPPVKSNEILDEIAEYFLLNPMDAAKKLTLDAYAKTKIHNFNLLWGCYNDKDLNVEAIVNGCLSSENENVGLYSKNSFLGKNIKEVGIAYNEKKKITVIISADKFAEGAEEPFDDEFARVFNKLRGNPKNYLTALADKQKEKKWVSARYITSLKNLQAEIGKRKGVRDVTLNAILSEACQELLEHSEQKKGLYREEEEILKLRLSHFCSGYKTTLQIIDQGSNKAEDIFLNSLLNEKDGAENLNTVFNEKVKYIGVACGKIQGRNSTVIILADEVKEIVETNFVESFREEINHMRVYPKSYIKVFQKIHEVPSTDAINDNIVRIKDEALKIQYFLKYCRTFGSLSQNEYLTKAAEARLSMFLKSDDGEFPADGLKGFLSDYCTGVNICEQIASSGFDSARSFLCSALLNIYDDDKRTRSLIFNQKFYNFGVAFDPESQTVVAIIADQANSPIILNEPVVSRKWDKLNRPAFTEDEINQLRRDFQSLDTNNIGFIYPNTILTFMHMVDDFKTKNPFYYSAFQNLNTIENNQNGVTFEAFADAVSNVIKLQTKEQWGKMFDILISGTDSKIINHRVLWGHMKSLNYDYTEEEVKEIVFKISHDGYDFDKSKKGDNQRDETSGLTKEAFTKIIMSIESNWQLK